MQWLDPSSCADKSQASTRCQDAPARTGRRASVSFPSLASPSRAAITESQVARAGVAVVFDPPKLPFGGKTQVIECKLGLCCCPGFFLASLFSFLPL